MTPLFSELLRGTVSLSRGGWAAARCQNSDGADQAEERAKEDEADGVFVRSGSLFIRPVRATGSDRDREIH
jgi:hypothetical protein